MIQDSSGFSSMQKDLVASIYVIHDQQVLLVWHEKLKKWLPPGGHLENGEMAHQGALRELQEETGLEANLFIEENIHIDSWNAKSQPRPFLMLLEEIPPWKNQGAHQHIDHVFIGTLKNHPAKLGPMKCKWFSIEELALLTPDTDIFLETVEVAKAAIYTLLKPATTVFKRSI